MSVVQKVILGFFVFITIYSTFEVYEELGNHSVYEPVLHFSLGFYVVLIPALIYVAYTVYKLHKQNTELEKKLNTLRKELENANNQLHEDEKKFQ